MNALLTILLVTLLPAILIFNLFTEWDNKINISKNFNTNFQWSQFLYSDNLPATKPPWGKIVSLNIINGNINWEVPSGYINNKKVGTSILEV